MVNVGDKVRVLKTPNNTNKTYYRKGMIGIVVSYHGGLGKSAIQVRFRKPKKYCPKFTRKDNRTWYLMSNEVEVIERAKVK